MIAKALDSGSVRYLVAGGLAVNAHGVLRFTKELDVVVQLISDNIARAFAALESLGYRPSVPVTLAQFSDKAQWQSWLEEKGMQVLQFWSDLSSRNADRYVCRGTVCLRRRIRARATEAIARNRSGAIRFVANTDNDETPRWAARRSFRY